MSGIFTKSMARNIFYGERVFFFLLFPALTFDTERELPNRDNRGAITPQVAAGKHLWKSTTAWAATRCSARAPTCSRARQRLQAPWWRLHQGLDASHAHRSLLAVARCPTSTHR